MSIRNSSDTTKYRNRDHPGRCAVPKPTAPPRAPFNVSWALRRSKFMTAALLRFPLFWDIMWPHWEICSWTINKTYCSHRDGSHYYFSPPTHLGRGPDSSVGIATELRAGRSRYRVPVGGQIFRTCSDRALGPTPPPVQWVPGLSRVQV